jgi:threonine synthase
LYAFNDPVNWKKNFIPKATIANGLAVPYPFGMNMMLKVLRESGGTVVTVEENEIIFGMKEIAKTEGILIAPEGAATWKALSYLRSNKQINLSDKILLLNTGSGYKYLENIN